MRFRQVWNAALRLLFILTIVSGLVLTPGCSGPAVLETDEAHAAADALYTAVTSRRPELLDSVAEHLRQLHTDLQLSAAAMASLDEIVALARGGEWQTAAEELDDFIRRQPPHKHTHKPAHGHTH